MNSYIRIKVPFVFGESLMYRTRNPPVHTAAICVHMPPSLREVVENYASKQRISLGEAGRSLLEAGAEALGLTGGAK